MPIIHIVIILVIIGVALWAINSIVPMDPTVKTIINVVIVLAIVVWLLQVFGVVGPIIN